ncbi:MAG: hypothetical protein J3K34DRAFT_74767 [Monoraphidium minutum]|nr:MAG: hypothetical protein J3K34DRAFT_74767 [Monoraphidium minutum]
MASASTFQAAFSQAAAIAAGTNSKGARAGLPGAPWPRAATKSRPPPSRRIAAAALAPRWRANNLHTRQSPATRTGHDRGRISCGQWKLTSPAWKALPHLCTTTLGWDSAGQGLRAAPHRAAPRRDSPWRHTFEHGKASRLADGRRAEPRGCGRRSAAAGAARRRRRWAPPPPLGPMPCT